MNLSDLEIHVAVGVIQNSAGQFLVAKRPPGKPLSGLWEFPGGKFNEGETVLQALARELKEELGISVLSATFDFTTDYNYQQKLIKLYICRVESYQGEPRGIEGQLLRWVNLDELKELPVPPANEDIIEKLFLFRNEVYR